MLNLKLLSVKPLPLIGLSLALGFGTMATAFARPCGGGDCSGGGSGLGARFFDAQARDNTLSISNEVHARLRPIVQAFDQLQEVGENSVNGYGLSQFLFSSARQRFVLVDKLPDANSSDIKHDMADRLVALQRGPMVWVDRNFVANASPEDLATFLVHEYLVSEKLKSGPLSKTDMDQVVHATAAIMDSFNASFSQTNADVVLQRILSRNGFREGMSRQQYASHLRLISRMTQSFENLCAGKVQEGEGLTDLRRIFRIITQRKTDQTLPLAAREEYQQIQKHIDEAIPANATKAQICELYEDGKLDEELASGKPRTSAEEIQKNLQQAIDRLEAPREGDANAPTSAR